MTEPSVEPSPGSASSEDELLGRLADDFAARRRRGEHPTADEYIAKHPQLAERIRKVLSAVGMIEQTVPLDFPDSERPGTTIGRYKLLERIGEGGFGMVYMAEQVTPVRRKVALKVVKPGMDSRQVLARFDAERQALAIMDHPNIAKVFDGGMTDAGRPYFVMELVKGVPITAFCDEHQLTPRARLELFAQVCHAVQHAHQKGIIHRDLKPSNVLVMMHDTVPVVKVIDFGVAKALGQDLTEQTLFTGFAQLIGTPLYMSPEQAGESALDIDTRSDIYSLGVLLYELLTGTTPFEKERFSKAAHDEIRRIIREEEPPRPSTRLGESKATLASISAQRRTEPARLTKLVRGELDWMVMKALEKDRSRRYETANGLAQDVQRYLADEPVLACPPSAGYRVKKFARRNKGPVIASAVVLLTLVGGVVGTSIGLVRAEQARRAAAERAKGELQAKLEAQERAAETKAVLDYLERRMFLAAGLAGEVPGASDPKLFKLLEETVARRKAKLGPHHVDTRASIKNLADGYRDRGLRSFGAGHVAEAVLDFDRAMELDPGEPANLLQAASNWYQAGALYMHAGDIDRYRGACRAMLDISDRIGAWEPEVSEWAARTCGLAPGSMADFSRVELAARRSMMGTEKHASRHCFVLAKGLTEYRAGRHDEALGWLQTLRPSAVGSYWDGGVFAVLAMVHHRLGHAEEAIASLDLARAVLEKRPWDWLRGSWHGWLQCEIHCREAEALIGAVSPQHTAGLRQKRRERELADLSRNVEENPDDDEPYHVRGIFLFHAGRFRESIADFDKSLELEPRHHAHLYEAAAVYLYGGDVERYRGACRALLDCAEKLTDNPQAAERTAKACALAPDSVPDFARVERLAERAVTGTEGHRDYCYLVLAKGLTDYRAGRYERAVEWLERIHPGSFGPNNDGAPQDATLLAGRAMAHHRLGHADQARAALDSARLIIERKPPKDLTGGRWYAWLHGEILLREAEQLLAK